MWNTRGGLFSTQMTSYNFVNQAGHGLLEGSMIMKHHIVAAALTLAGMALAPNAYAAGSVSASYWTLTSENPDTGGAITGVETGLVKPTLEDGLPVESMPGNFQDVNSKGELLWWTPQTNLVLPGTTASYPTTVTLPFNIQSNFFPDGDSGSNGGDVGFTSAILSGTFDTPAGGSVTFNLGSDDDAWVFLNGNLVVDNGGVHALATAPTVVTGLAPGVNTVEVFFADRHTTQAGLFFDADVTVNPSVPEASTWAMMLTGFAGLGFAAFRRARQAAPTSA
jgi:fibro-slime domain-containing protein